MIHEKLICEKATTQILVVSDEITFNPPLSQVIEEKIEVEILDCFVCTDKVVFNGLVKKCIVYCPVPVTQEQTSVMGTQLISSDMVRLQQLEIEFPGFIVVPGAMRGDKCIAKGHVGDCKFLSPIEKDDKGNIIRAVEKLIVDVTVKIIREDC